MLVYCCVFNLFLAIVASAGYINKVYFIPTVQISHKIALLQKKIKKKCKKICTVFKIILNLQWI